MKRPRLEGDPRPASTWLVLAALLLVAGGLAGDADFARATTTYGNFDVPSDRSGIEALAPGVPDLARLREYRFGPDVPVHKTPLVALGVVFLVFLVLRVRGSIDGRLGVTRGWFQWGSFVLARIGVLRASNTLPVARCTFGTFPFLNCQYCEMASGACPVGVTQSALATGRFPAQAVGVVAGVGAASGRWICGWFCPFGLFLDICERGRTRGPVRIPHRLRAGKFVMLGLVVAGAVALGLAGVRSINGFCATVCPAGSLYGLIPYWGTTAARPFADVLMHFDVGSGAHWIVAGHVLFFVLFLVVTFKVAGRFFCSVLCPLGAALALFSRRSLVRVVHEDSLCDGCGACVRVCPTGIDLARDDWLTVSDCVQCKRCISVCPTGARGWSFDRPVAAPAPAERPIRVAP